MSRDFNKISSTLALFGTGVNRAGVGAVAVAIAKMLERKA